MTTTDEGPKAELRQYYTAFVAHFGALIMAMVWSFSATALPSMRDSVKDLGNITGIDEAWIASITFLAGAIGSPVMGTIAQKLGLKRSLIVASVPLIIGWAMITFATNIHVILIARFLTGFMVSGVSASGSLIAELSHEKRRGRLNTAFDLLFCVGVLVIYVVGTFLNWRWQAAVCGIFSTIWFGLLFTIPESPRCSLANHKKPEEAKKTLRWIRDMDDDGVTSEFNKIKLSLGEDADKTDTEDLESRQGLTSNGNVGPHFSPNEPSFLKMLFSCTTLKPIFLATMLQFFLQVCGVVPIVCYAVDVFKAAGGSEGVHENISTITLGAVNLIATMIAYNFVDKYGRRVLMIGSEACLFLSLFVLGGFFYFRENLGYDLSNWFWSWFPLIIFVIFIFTYSFGVGPLPWVIMGEIFSPNAKGISNGIVNFAARVFGFLVMFYFKSLLLVIGQHGVYWFFSAVCLFGLIFTWLFIPETKNRSLEDIQIEIKNKWFHHKHFR